MDPIRFDRRALSAIMGDEIPYTKWDRQFSILTRAGYATWQEYLADKEEFNASQP